MPIERFGFWCKEKCNFQDVSPQTKRTSLLLLFIKKVKLLGMFTTKSEGLVLLLCGYLSFIYEILAVVCGCQS